MALSQQLFRRKPITPPVEAPGGLQRRIGTFQLAMFGVGATVGTGVFFVMHEATPDAGPAVVLAFLPPFAVMEFFLDLPIAVAGSVLLAAAVVLLVGRRQRAGARIPA